MAHPFFEVTRFPAYRAEAIELHRVLRATYETQAKLVNLYDQCGPDLPGLTFPATVEDLWHEALRNLTKAQPALKTLCELVKAQYPGNQEVQRAILAIENAVTAKEVRIISSDVLVLDREPLRTKIERIAPENATAKVLLVRGDSQSGKSHARHLFILNAKENGAEPIYLYNGIIPTLKQVLEQLFSPFEPEKPPPVDTTDPGWYQSVCNKLQALAAAKNKVLWIAVDDLGEKNGAPLLDPTIKEFFDQFAMNMLNPPFKKSFRLMLIHYPSKVPTKWKKEIYIPDELKATDIGDADVEALLKEWRTSNGKFLTDEKLATAAKEVITAAEAAHAEAVAAAQAAGETEFPSRLEFINEKLTEKLLTL